MKILIVPDVAGWAIDQLVQVKIKYNPHHTFRCHYVHPRDAASEDIQKEFMDVVNEFDPDIIHFEYFRSCSQLLESCEELKSRKIVLTHHNQRTKALKFADWDKIGVDHIVTHTAKCKQFLVDECEYPEERITQIQHGIDLSYFVYEGKDPEEPAVGYAGRIVPWKGLKEIAEVSLELGYQVMFMGRQDKATYFNTISEEAKKNINFSFMDCKDEDRLDYYKSLTCYVGNSIDGYEEGCYSADTEVLTSRGWILFMDLTKEDEIATLNPKTEKLEYQKPVKLVEYEDKKELIKIQNSTVDLMVTPGHNMWVSKPTTGVDREEVYKPYELVKAGDLPSKFKIKRVCSWDGYDIVNDEMVALWGMMIADGWCDEKRLVISVMREDKVKRGKEILDKLGLSYKEYDNGLNVFNVEFIKNNDLVKCIGCGAKNKKIPDFIKYSTPRQIEIFLDYFGDKHVREAGWREFYSSSIRLIGDIQECLIKIGRNGDVKVIDRIGQKSWCNNHWIETKNLQYKISERVKKTDSYIRKKYDMSVVPDYEGKVYCAEVPNHIMLVRRNGCACFCGNTLEYLEAMACGVPIITTPNGIAREWAVDEENALVIPFGDKEALKVAVDRIMTDEDLRNKLRKNGWETVKNYTQEKMAYRYSKVYNEVFYKDDPLVSVIIPATHSRIKQVEKILESLTIQSYKNIEALICFDEELDFATTFATEKARLKKMFPNLTLKLNFTGRDGYNLAMSRNMMAINAEGKMLVFLDSRLDPDENAIKIFVEALRNSERAKCWVFGDKGSGKKSFVENFSAIKRKIFINFGMFNERIDRYGGMSQEIRDRFINQGGRFVFLPSATCTPMISSKRTPEKKQDIISSKLKLYKMYESNNY